MISNRDLASYTFTSLTNKVSKGLLTDDGLELQEDLQNNSYVKSRLLYLKIQNTYSEK